MAWENAEWSCGHTGRMQLYGKMSGRDSRVAYEAGKTCMACWLIEQWEEKNDPRCKREDKWALATAIAKGKGVRIEGRENISPEPVKEEQVQWIM